MINLSTSNITVSTPPVAASHPKALASDAAAPSPADENKVEKSDSKPAGKNTKDTNPELTQAEVQELLKLRERDREVRAHEQAHISAGGQYVRGGAHYEYQKGPDGKSYAVGGEVQIDTSKIPDNPEATARKMAAIKRAAMAPAEPSAQDRRVASKASRIQNQMTMEILLKLQKEKTNSAKGSRNMPPKGSLIDIQQ